MPSFDRRSLEVLVLLLLVLAVFAGVFCIGDLLLSAVGDLFDELRL